MSQTVTITLNTVAQTQGVKATIAGLDGVQGAVKRLSGSLGSFVDQYMGRLAAVLSAGAFVRFSKQAVDSADALAKNAQAAGIAVDKFSALAYVGDLARASQETLMSSSKFLSQWMVKSGSDSKDLTEALLEQADVFAAMADGPEKVRLAVERFGRSGQQMIPFLNQGSEAIREQMREAEAFGVVIGPRFARNAQQFNDNLTRFKNLFQGLFKLLADALLPAFIEWQESFLAWVKESGAHVALVDTLIQVYQGFALVFIELKAAVMGVVQGFMALGAFAGDFAVTKNLTSAAEAANKLITFYKEAADARDRLFGIGRKADPGAPGAPGGIPAADNTEEAKARLAENASKISLIQSASFVRERDRNRELNELYRERLELLEAQRDVTIKLARSPGDIEGRIVTREVEIDGIMRMTDAYAEQAEALAKNQEEYTKIEETLQRISDQDFFGRLKEGLFSMSEEVANLGVAMADVLLNGIGSAIDALSTGIWNVIDGTKTWGEIFQSVARNIISDIIKIALQWVISQTLMRTLSAIFGKAAAATTAAEAASATAAWAPAATMASIATMGAAAGVGTAALAGALAVGVGLATAGSVAGGVAGFAEGGIIGGGEQFIRVNEAGTEAVLNAGATAALGSSMIHGLNTGLLGVRDLESRMTSNLSPPPFSGAPGESAEGLSAIPGMSGAQQVNISLVLVDSRNAQAARDFVMSSNGKVIIADIIREQKLDVGIER